MKLLIHEWKMNQKSLLTWIVCIGISCMACIAIFNSVVGNMGEMQDINIIFSLAGVLYAAITGVMMLSKEVEGHTAEFLHTLPLSRTYIVLWKYVSLVLLVLVLNIASVFMDMLGFLVIDGNILLKELLIYHGASLVMQIEIASICFFISAVSLRNQFVLGVGISVFLYLINLLCRIVPGVDILKYVTPFYYANAADIFSTGTVEIKLIILGVAVAAVAAIAAAVIYKERDL